MDFIPLLCWWPSTHPLFPSFRHISECLADILSWVASHQLKILLQLSCCTSLELYPHVTILWSLRVTLWSHCLSLHYPWGKHGQPTVLLTWETDFYQHSFGCDKEPLKKSFSKSAILNDGTSKMLNLQGKSKRVSFSWSIAFSAYAGRDSSLFSSVQIFPFKTHRRMYQMEECISFTERKNRSNKLEH